MAISTGAAIGAGVAGSLIGGGIQADAARGAARAQERSAREQLAFAKESQKRAIEAAESPQQLAQLEKSIAQQERGVQREEKFLSSIDPTLVEASQQALRLLRGEESQATAPARQQRQRQRQMLVDQLREQLGPGAETSSAGIQALNQFDQQTSAHLSGVQQQSLGTLLGSSQQSAGMGRSSLAQFGQQGLGIAQGFGNIAGRQVNAITGSQNAVSQAGAGVTGAAGSGFVGQQLGGQLLSGIGGGLAQAGMQSAFGTPSTPSALTPGGFTGSVNPKFGSIA